MRSLFIIFIFAVPLIAWGQKNKYGYPIDPQTNKIIYQNTIKVTGTKEKLFKNAQQFLAIMSFDKIITIKTHSGKQLNSSIVKQPITYQDKEEGKIFGNGYLPFEYRGHDYFFITFSYRLYVKGNEYRYVFTDFIVQEVVDPGFASDRRTESKSFPLEEFVDRPLYHKSDPVFLEQVKNLRHQLKLAMLGEL